MTVRGFRLAVTLLAGLLAQAAVVWVTPPYGAIAVTATLGVVALLGTAGFLRLARQTRGRARAGWFCAGFAAAMWGLTNLVWLATIALGLDGTTAGWAVNTSLSALTLAPIPAALLLLSPVTGSVAVRTRRALDCAMIFGALSLIAWQLVLSRVYAELDPVSFALAATIPGIELMVAAIAIVLLSRSLAGGPNAINLLAGGMLLFSLATLAYLQNLATGQPWYAGWVACGYLVATITVVTASRYPMPQHASTESEQLSGRWALLPYAPVALAFGAAALQQARTGSLGPVLPWVLLGTSALVLIRQFLGVRTNQALLLDLTRQRAQLARQAYSDPLTGLANRTLFVRHAEEALADAGEETVTGVILLDLDGFKAVNDTWGHGAGDELLCGVAERLRAAVRGTDTVARLGGDEFVILLPRLAAGEVAEAVAHRILADLAAPLPVAGVAVPARASAGMALAVGARTALDALLREADLALYQAKAQGKGRMCRFDPAAHATDLHRRQLEAELREALPRREFELHYQPIVALDGGRTVGVEALLRWRHPQRGLLAPAAFLDLAEAVGMLVELGRWVLDEACRQAADWQTERPGLELNVNLSASQLTDPDLVERVRGALVAAGLAPHLLVLELTETVALTDLARSAAVLHELRGLGVRIALDDFGTGYSSLSHLGSLPVDVVKIDKSFVQAMDGPGGGVAEAVLQIARTFGLAPVAEGVEDADQARRLRDLDCAQAQGYHFARPMPAPAFTARLAAEPAESAESAGSASPAAV